MDKQYLYRPGVDSTTVSIFVIIFVSICQFNQYIYKLKWKCCQACWPYQVLTKEIGTSDICVSKNNIWKSIWLEVQGNILLLDKSQFWRMMVCLFFFCYCVHFPFEENIFAGTEAGLVQNYKFPLTFLIFLVFPAPVQEHAKFSRQNLKILKK